MTVDNEDEQKPLTRRVAEAASDFHVALAVFCSKVVDSFCEQHNLPRQEAAPAFAIAFLKELENAVTYHCFGDAGADMENDKMHDWALIKAFPIIEQMVAQERATVQRRIDAANDELRRN